MLARMNATNRFLIWGTMPLGAATGGLLAAITDLHTTVTIAAAAIPLATAAVLLSAVRQLRTMPTTPTTTLTPTSEEEPALVP
jgi:hypothetical protein